MSQDFHAKIKDLKHQFNELLKKKNFDQNSIKNQSQESAEDDNDDQSMRVSSSSQSCYVSNRDVSEEKEEIFIPEPQSMKSKDLSRLDVKPLVDSNNEKLILHNRVPYRSYSLALERLIFKSDMAIKTDQQSLSPNEHRPRIKLSDVSKVIDAIKSSSPAPQRLFQSNQ